MLLPITARPVTPICAVPVVSAAGGVIGCLSCSIVAQRFFADYEMNSLCSSVSHGTASAIVGTTSTAVAARYAPVATMTLLPRPPSRRTRTTVLGPPAASAPDGVGPAAHATRARAREVGPAA